MNAIPFAKMSGLGNDFIIVDNRNGILEELDLHELARRLCTRRLSLGADELVVIEKAAAGSDFAMRTFNPDGNEVPMCGNAARCVARYAYTKLIAGSQMIIETRGGPIEAWADGDSASIKLQLTAPPRLNLQIDIGAGMVILHELHVSGAPHAVVFVDDLSALTPEQLLQRGTLIRHHPAFPEGINANFVQIKDAHHLIQRTYERGVEGETMACGTGAAASSAAAALIGLAQSPLQVQTLGGVVPVTFSLANTKISDLVLGGGARFIAEGFLHPEAWSWQQNKSSDGVIDATHN